MFAISGVSVMRKEVFIAYGTNKLLGPKCPSLCQSLLHVMHRKNLSPR